MQNDDRHKKSKLQELEEQKAHQKKAEQEKERIKADIAKRAIPTCKICGKYLFIQPRCGGHSAGGGGSSGGGSEEKTGKENQEPTKASGQITDAVAQAAYTASTPDQPIGASAALRPELSRERMLDVISEMLSNKSLTIDNDRDKGILAIKLLIEPTLLPEEQRNAVNKFVGLILQALHKFLKENGIDKDFATVVKDKDGNIKSCRIAIPDRKLHEKFIDKLAEQHLLPLQNIHQHAHEKVEYPRGQNHFNPTPKPKAAVKEDDHHATQQPRKRRSPLDIPEFKPKGSSF